MGGFPDLVAPSRPQHLLSGVTAALWGCDEQVVGPGNGLNLHERSLAFLE
jgi:hypothetical protein